MSAERWLQIPGVDGYEASDAGRVRSVERIVSRARFGKHIPVRRQGVLLRTKTNARNGYVSVQLAGLDYLVHRLVLLAFVGPCPDGMEAAHGDGVRNHNALHNLRYATRTENAGDRRRHGTLLHGERIASAKLTSTQVQEIRSARGRESQRALAGRFGVSRQQIGNIHQGRCWSGFTIHEEKRVV